MKQLILVILFLSIVTFMKCDDNPVCDCCKDMYGLGCEPWNNGYGWWGCADKLEDVDHKYGTRKPLVELVQLEDDEQCEGTPCPAGCCPEKCWYCCPDYWCAPTAADCL